MEIILISILGLYKNSHLKLYVIVLIWISTGSMFHYLIRKLNGIGGKIGYAGYQYYFIPYTG